MVHNELAATKLVSNRTETRAHFLVFILRPQAVSKNTCKSRTSKPQFQVKKKS